MTKNEYLIIPISNIKNILENSTRIHSCNKGYEIDPSATLLIQSKIKEFEKLDEKIKHEENNKLNEIESQTITKINHDWYDKLRARAVTYNKELQTDYLNGYVEKVVDFPFFE
ncbi:unnamed protein product [Brachionus calyciflorus]|uniref:Uncharacterized protein n=1 Tax=Brachionus calyciflorus TaxID=104777 RepID=A0A814DF75_9BILA|nr:unnamed protein product [Brachionus calyciflorus]